MSNSNYSIGLQRLEPVHTASCGLHSLAENWSWAQDVNGRDRDETETLTIFIETRPRRDVGTSLDRLETETTTLLYGVPEYLLRKVHAVGAKRCRSSTHQHTRRRDHITPMLRQLHWLPVQRRVEFKIACHVHQSLASTCQRTSLPTFDRLISEHGRPHLRSSSHRTYTGCSTDAHQLRGQKFRC